MVISSPRHPMGWGLGRNNGKVPELLDLLAPKFIRPETPLKQPLNLIGWGLGGYLARELARDYPEDDRFKVSGIRCKVNETKPLCFK